MEEELRKGAYLQLKKQLMILQRQIESLNKDYDVLTDYLQQGLKINNNIIDADEWFFIGNHQKEVTNDLNQVVLPIVNRNINS